jgi:uncharacterized damage-inducible protein DinB
MEDVCCERSIIVYDTPLSIEQMLTMLAEAPLRIAALTVDLPPAQLVKAPKSGEWSARDVLAHLRACSDMWGKYILLILSQDSPVFKAVNPTTWIKQTDYLEQEFHPSLQAYTAQRTGLLEVLQDLAPADWSRTATVTGAGKPRQRTVYTYGEWLANHERSHLKQIERIVTAVSTA